MKIKKAPTKKAPLRRWKPPPPFSITVQYKGGPDTELEKVLSKVAKGHSLGSGYSFIDDMRDLEFGAQKRASAIATAKKLKAVKRGLKVRVTGQVWP